MIRSKIDTVTPRPKKPDYPVLLRNNHYRDMIVLAFRKCPNEAGKFEGIVVQGSVHPQAKYSFGDWVNLYHTAYSIADDVSVTIQND